MTRYLHRLTVVLLASIALGCDLTDVAIVDISEVLVAEVYVTVAEAPNANYLRAFLHGTGPGGAPSSTAFPNAEVIVTDGSGVPSVLFQTTIAECAAVLPDNADGSCYAADAVLAASYQPGESLSLAVTLPDGRDLTGQTRIPGAFVVDGASGTCRVPPDTRLSLGWSRSDSAWAYLSEALILGLPGALAAEGIEAPDTVYLLGLSISEADTTVVFPNQFGVFDRFDLDRDLAVRLQEGLPEGATAQVAITAVERNYVNWVRGGNFNPSGAVRVPSLVGDGSGVFGAAVTRQFTIVSSTDTASASPCSGV